MAANTGAPGRAIAPPVVARLLAIPFAKIRLIQPDETAVTEQQITFKRLVRQKM